MNKKAMSYLVGIILALVALGLLLWVGYEFRAVLFQTGEKTTCNWSLLLSKVGSFLVTDIPSECATTKLTVTQKIFKTYSIIAERTVDEYHETPGYEKVSAYYPKTELGYQKWTLDKIMTDQMVKCWDKTWHGAMNPTQWTKAFKVDIVCVICARVEFDTDLPVALKHQQLSLVPWMQAETYHGKTYYDYVMQDQEPESWQKNPYYDLDKRWAIVYWYMEPDKLAKMLKKTPLLKIAQMEKAIINFFPKLLAGEEVVSIKPDQTTHLFLWPYDDITKPWDFGGLGCQKILG